MASENEDQNTGENASSLKTKSTSNILGKWLGKLSFPLTLCFISFSSLAQPTNEIDAAIKRHQIKTNPAILFLPVWNLNYEFRATENKAVQLGVSFLDQANFIDTEMNGAIITFDYKYYLRKRRNRRGYLQPYLRYQNIEYAGNGDTITQNKIGGGVSAGRVYEVTEWLVLDLSLGFNFIPTGYKTLETDGEIDVVLPPTLYGFGPRIGVLIGVTF